MKPYQIVLIVLAVLIVLGVAIIPAINRRQLKKMPIDQQIRILMQQANKLIYWKNISEGTKGTLVYIKDKRKILTFPWILVDGAMLCTRKNPFEKWDYPEEQEPLTSDELAQLKDEIEKYNKKTPVKILFQMPCFYILSKILNTAADIASHIAENGRQICPIMFKGAPE